MNFSKKQEPVLFFDGECGLCDRAIAYLLDARNADRLRYAPQGGSTFQALVVRRPEVALSDSLIVWEPATEKYFIEATGLSLALKRLGGFRGFLGHLIAILPTAISNSIYRWVARNRLRFFPYKGRCSILSEEKRALILP